MQKEIIYLAFYKEITLSEISKILEVTIGTIKTQCHRGKINRAYKGVVKGDALALTASDSPMSPVEITAMRAE